ncbi:MAG: hypothetical protein ACK6CT_05570 [Planctomycetia bacterium]
MMATVVLRLFARHPQKHLALLAGRPGSQVRPPQADQLARHAQARIPGEPDDCGPLGRPARCHELLGVLPADVVHPCDVHLRPAANAVKRVRLDHLPAQTAGEYLASHLDPFGLGGDRKRLYHGRPSPAHESLVGRGEPGAVFVGAFGRDR